jgi:tetratricopeptide (TPR) repeat protein
MKNVSPKMLLALAGLSLTLSLSTSCEKLQARDHLNKGVNAFKAAKYPQAVEFFKKAVELDPSFDIARLYLATAYRTQYIPGADSDENKAYWNNALEEFTKVYKADPTSKLALQSIASLHFDAAQGMPALDDKFKKLDEAREWHDKLLKLDPAMKESWYTLGVIAWMKTYPVRKKARVELKLKDDQPGPISDKKVLAELRTKNMATVDGGIEAMRKAIAVDKEYDDAMAYLNLLLREKADISESKEDFKKYSDEADEWVSKAVETKKIKAARTPQQTGIVQEETK